MSSTLLYTVCGLALFVVLSATAVPEKPVIVIGASYGNGKSPIDANAVGTLDGLAVGDGSYLDLGAALTRELSKGFVINEAVAGATTYARLDFLSYEAQLNIAFKRVQKRPTTDLNAQFAIITIPNDCLHAASPDPVTGAYCTTSNLISVVDRLEAVANQAIARGLTAVVMDYPPWATAQTGGINMAVFQQVFGMPWVISQADYTFLSNAVRTRFSTKPNTLFVSSWDKHFQPLADGIHPQPATMKRAAKRVAVALDCQD